MLLLFIVCSCLRVIFVYVSYRFRPLSLANKAKVGALWAGVALAKVCVSLPVLAMTFSYVYVQLFITCCSVESCLVYVYFGTTVLR